MTSALVSSSRQLRAALRFFALPFALLLLFATPAHADSLSTAKAEIGKQVGFIKAGNVKKLQASLTQRFAGRVTDDMIKKAKKEVGSITLAELVHEVAGSGTSIKIKMKNGRTLTTLVKVDGKWLADTLWFK
jgi:hypothetical protein